jgi:hypothetical protein
LTFVVFGLLGSFLLINLALPIASLLFHADWAGWVTKGDKRRRLFRPNLKSARGKNAFCCACSRQFVARSEISQVGRFGRS